MTNSQEPSAHSRNTENGGEAVRGQRCTGRLPDLGQQGASVVG